MDTGLATGGKVWKMPVPVGSTNFAPSRKLSIKFLTPEILMLLIILATGFVFVAHMLVRHFNVPSISLIKNNESSQTLTSPATGYFMQSTVSFSVLPFILTSIIIVVISLTILFSGKFSLQRIFLVIGIAMAIAFISALLTPHAENKPQNTISVAEWANQRYDFIIDDTAGEKFNNSGTNLHTGLIVKDTQHSVIAEFKFKDNQYYLTNPFTGEELPTASTISKEQS